MRDAKHYIIGDVHGEYEMLLELVEQLPPNARLIFVGDLVNRGKKSREVIEFVRKNSFGVVKGNHEEYMLEHGKHFLDNLQKSKEELKNIWMYVGGVQMLQSYRLLSKDKANPFKYIRNEERISSLKRDLAWIETLPLCLELGEVNGYNLPVVISHGSIGNFWHLKDENPNHFEFHCLTNRERPTTDATIFNIYGHVVVDDVTIGENFVSLDTGCGKGHDGKLSAFCLESQEVFEVCKEGMVA